MPRAASVSTSFRPFPVLTRIVRHPAPRPASRSLPMSPTTHALARSTPCSRAASSRSPGRGFRHAHPSSGAW